MRVLLTISVLAVAVSAAMVAVCEHTEVCRLRYRLWQVQRRHDALEREIRELDAALAEHETPTELLRGVSPEAVDVETPARAPTARGRAPVRVLPAGRDLRWYEGDD